MRKQKSGCVLQISSAGGRLAVAGNAAYHAAKWAVGGFTETIAQEVAPLGVRVCALEPGGIRTNWGKRANAGTPKLLPEYEASVGARIQMLQGHWGHEMSDPAKVAQVILQLATKDQLPAHLLLGSDAVQFARLAEERRDSDAKIWRDISVSTDAQDVKGLPDLKF
jgi:NAD(P)-dependent dehydrogenase (short-subunit alcohol dehydrogenase family)